MKKWRNYKFESSCYITKEFLSFSRAFKKYITKGLDVDSELIGWSIGHFYVSGFIKKENNYVYFSTFDVRYFDWYDKILVRTAKHEKDYIGGQNNYTNMENFHRSIQSLFKNPHMLFKNPHILKRT